MIESGSSIQTFLTCQKLFEFKYVKLLEPRGYSSAMGFGTFLHAFVEQDRGGSQDAPGRELARIKAKSPDSARQAEIDFAMAERFFDMWKVYWARAPIYNNADFEWISVEKEWGFPVGADTHVGKSDGVVRDKKTGAIFLYELKTAADRDREGYVHKLEIDRQVSSNIMALQKEGVVVAGALYDIVWKPGLRRLTGRKTKPDETPEEFMARTVAAVFDWDEDEWNSEGPGKQPPYFERQIIYRSDRMMAEHEKDLSLQFAAMRDAASRGYARNTGACYNFGSMCRFYNACIEGREELEELYVRKDRKLPELSKEIQSANP